MTTATNTIKQQLQDIATSDDNALRRHVANYYAEYSDDSDEIQGHILDVLRYGCESGSVSEMIYYNDTHAFFDKFTDEIDDLRTEYEEGTGEPLHIGQNLKNFLAWFAWEQVTSDLAGELGIE